jgi:hypothetical protein
MHNFALYVLWSFQHKMKSFSWKKGFILNLRKFGNMHVFVHRSTGSNWVVKIVRLCYKLGNWMIINAPKLKKMKTRGIEQCTWLCKIKIVTTVSSIFLCLELKYIIYVSMLYLHFFFQNIIMKNTIKYILLNYIYF